MRAKQLVQHDNTGRTDKFCCSVMQAFGNCIPKIGIVFVISVNFLFTDFNTFFESYFLVVLLEAYRSQLEVLLDLFQIKNLAHHCY